MENTMVRVTRIGGSWSGNADRTMTLLEMINWMNKYGYKAKWMRNCKDGKRRINYRKPDCNTEYQVIIPA